MISKTMLLTALALLACGTAHAQFGGTMAPTVDILQGTAFITLNEITRQQQLSDRRAKRRREQAAGEKTDATGAEPATNTPAAAQDGGSTLAPRLTGPARTPARLAATYPAARRAEVERVFRDMLSAHQQIERKFGIARNDVAGAVAVFLAGSYMAHRNTSFSDQHFPALIEQMRAVLLGNDAFARASEPEKQDTYEELAILDMFMASNQMTLQAKPDPQLAGRLRDTGRDYLERFLKTDASRIEITSDGLMLRR